VDLNCPVCKTTKLSKTQRQNVELCYCPRCKGIWLQRGALDKIVEKSSIASVDFAEKSGNVSLQISRLDDEIYKELSPKTPLHKVFDF